MRLAQEYLEQEDERATYPTMTLLFHIINDIVEIVMFYDNETFQDMLEESHNNIPNRTTAN